jgi:cytochrome b
MAAIRVWDLPTRIVHWLFVVLLPLLWWTAESGRMDWHRYCGYTLFGVLVFRLYWGFAGTSTARFARFVRGPRTIAAYLRGAWPEEPGHNPLGALSVVALLAMLAAQVTLGLFAVDVDGIESGPLSIFVSFDTGRAAAGWHEDGFDVLLALVVLHVAAVLYYLLARRRNLIGAMVHGARESPLPQESVQFAGAARLWAGVALAATLAWVISTAFGRG